MTKEDFIERYGDVEVSFYSYTKFMFNFRGKTKNGCEIDVNIGGDPDSISRLNVLVNKPITIEELDPDAGGVFCGEYLIDDFDEWHSRY